MSTTHRDPAPGVPVARSSAAVPAPRRARDAARPAAVAGILFAVAFFVAVASLDVPRGASDTEMQAFWRDAANRTAMITSTVALAAAGLLFLGFLTYLTHRLTAGRSEAEAGLAPRLAQHAGVSFVCMVFATGLTGAIARGLVVDNEPVPSSDLLRYFAQIRYTAMGVFAMPAVALVIACTAYVVLRDGVLPRWLGWLSVACVVIIVPICALLVGALAIPVVLVWAISCSVVFLRHHP
jgi:phosphotransferase system  glucose/maltose/N-acetylglucosamine-specific IIC component